MTRGKSKRKLSMFTKGIRNVSKFCSRHLYLPWPDRSREQSRRLSPFHCGPSHTSPCSWDERGSNTWNLWMLAWPQHRGPSENMFLRGRTKTLSRIAVLDGIGMREAYRAGSHFIYGFSDGGLDPTRRDVAERAGRLQTLFVSYFKHCVLSFVSSSVSFTPRTVR
jgi:hypothetical protein